MALMSRIRMRDFLQLTEEERLTKITDVQALRTDALAEARVKKGRKTKSATRNLAKRGKKPVDNTSKLAKILKGLTPDQIAKLKESYGL